MSAGETAVVRGILGGRSWYELAVRVLDADEASVTTARWPGTASREISHYVEFLRTGDPKQRYASRESRARGDWRLVDSAWQRTGVVDQVVSGRWFAVSRMHRQDGELLCWYVNFERPPAWRAGGWDTSDLAITDTEHAAVQASRDEAVALVEARAGVFAPGTAAPWLPDPAWPLPVLP